MSSIIDRLSDDSPDHLIARTQVGNVLISTVKIPETVKKMDEIMCQLYDQMMERGKNEELDENYDFLKVPGEFETMAFPCEDNGKIIVNDFPLKKDKTGTRDAAKEMHERYIREFEDA